MFKKISLGLLIFVSAVSFVSCGPKGVEIEGAYRRVKKVDMANMDETVYKKGSMAYKIGYDIRRVGDKIIINRNEIDKDGNSIISKRSKPFEIIEMDTDVYQFKNEDKSIALTFYFGKGEFSVAEFVRQDSLAYNKESVVYYTLLKK